MSKNIILILGLILEGALLEGKILGILGGVLAEILRNPSKVKNKREENQLIQKRILEVNFDFFILLLILK